MNNLERYLDQVIENRPVVVEKAQDVIPDAGTQTTPNIFAALRRRWRIILATFVLGCVIGLPAVWFLIKPKYVVSAAIRVTPILQNVLTGEADRGNVSNYTNFVQTQAEFITSGMVLERVADDFAGKNLAFFKGGDMPLSVKLRYNLRAGPGPLQPVMLLKDAVFYKVITVAPLRNTEFIHVTMKSKSQQEAQQIVDSFIRHYMAVEGSSSAENRDQQLRLLENEQRNRAEKLRNQHDQMRKLAEESGNTVLAGTQDAILQRSTALLTELTKLESQRANLEVIVQVLEKTQGQALDPNTMISQREGYINANASVQELTRSVMLLEQDIFVAKQKLAPANPAIKQREEILESFKARLAEKRKELAGTYDASIAELTERRRVEQLAAMKAQLELIKAYEQRMNDTINKQEGQATALGRTQRQIESLQFETDLDQKIFEIVSRRVQEVEMERKRPARVSVAYDAELRNIEDKRVKYSAAVMFGMFAFGSLLAFLRDKLDKTLETPADVTANAGMQLIGTTTSSRNVKPAQFAEQLAGDYQIIRTNLDQLTGEGMPKRLAVTSPGMREGKTTFAINLATSMARAGKKVLLIDGDFRKPDVAHMLGIPNGSSGLREVLSGNDPTQAVRSITSSGFDVLLAVPGSIADTYELLVSPIAARQMDSLCRKYDHVIVDTPPALVFPDALVWAKMVDGVILVTFAGQTTTTDLKEAKDRLAKVRARVLGTILSNVSPEHSYYRAGYAYYSRGAQAAAKTGRIGKKLLLPLDSKQESETGAKK